MIGLITADGALFTYERAIEVVYGNPDDHEWYSPSLNFYSETKHKDSIRVDWLESALHSAWIRHLKGVVPAIRILREASENQKKYETHTDGVYDWIPLDGLRNAVAEYIDEHYTNYSPVICANCGWEGSSKHIQVDPLDKTRMSCHHCQSDKIYDAEEYDLKQLAQETIDVNAVVDFSFDMRIKLAEARRKGRSGWETCEPQVFADMFADHLFKNNDNNLIDLANLLMFFRNRGGNTAQLFQTILERMVHVSWDVAAKGSDTSAVFLRVDMSKMAPIERSEFKNRLIGIKENLNIPLVVVNPDCQIHAISEDELAHSGVVLNRIADQEAE